MTETIMIDIPILADQSFVADREAFSAQIIALGAEHGVNHYARYDTTKHLRGAFEGAVGANLWAMDSPSQLQAVLDDERYIANIETRDRIHDMDRLTMYQASLIRNDGTPSPDGLALLDFVVLKPDVEPEDRADYAAALAAIADPLGARVLQTYRIDQQLRGELPEATEFSVWEIPSIEALTAVTTHPDYVAMIPERDRLHDMSRLTMILAKPVGPETP